MRILNIVAKCPDGYSARYITGSEMSVNLYEIDGDGTDLGIEGIAEGEYLDITIDLDTGKIVDFKPVEEDDLIEQFESQGKLFGPIAVNGKDDSIGKIHQRALEQKIKRAKELREQSDAEEMERHGHLLGEGFIYNFPDNIDLVNNLKETENEYLQKEEEYQAGLKKDKKTEEKLADQMEKR